mgnify:CR=1 FL=1
MSSRNKAQLEQVRDSCVAAAVAAGETEELFVPEVLPLDLSDIDSLAGVVV